MDRTLQFNLSVTIPESYYKQLTFQGYSNIQIDGFIRSHTKDIIDLNRINIPVTNIEINPVMSNNGISYESERENICMGFSNPARQETKYSREW